MNFCEDRLPSKKLYLIPAQFILFLFITTIYFKEKKDYLPTTQLQIISNALTFVMNEIASRPMRQMWLTIFEKSQITYCVPKDENRIDLHTVQL